MNKNKLSNPVRLIAFFLTAFILICTFGFTVDGWNIFDKNKDNTPQDNDQSAADNNDQLTEDIPVTAPPEQETIAPEYYNRLTGIACDEATSLSAYMAFVMNSALPAYGLSYADLLCEVPVENGGSRYVAFISNTDNLWKIGSITHTRGYISNLIKYFGAICISNGTDDTKYYPQCNIKDTHLDLSVTTGSHYTEYTSNIYTNRDLLISGLSSAEINTQSTITPAMPFDFVTNGSSINIDKTYDAQRIALSDDAKTELIYDSEAASYLIYKSGSPLTDCINGKSLDFKNCFILYADSIKYDTTECSQMIMDTIGYGSGFYFTEGRAYSITWSATSDGTLSFYNEGGEKLIVNRGRSYVCYMKSSQLGLLKYE